MGKTATLKMCIRDRLPGNRNVYKQQADAVGQITNRLDNKEIDNFQLCAQLRVCSQAGGIPVYPRFSQPDNSESWDDAGNGI